MKISEVTGSQARAKYEAFIASIDNSVAGRDENRQTLADRVAASAEQNANDTMQERGFDAWPVNEPEYWVIALDSARFMLDDWRSNYPELRVDSQLSVGGHAPTSFFGL